MKTSNKILLAGSTLFLLLAVAATTPLIKEYNRTKDYARQFQQQFSETPIHTLIVENSGTTRYSGIGQPRIYLQAPPTPAQIAISGDTLLIRHMPPVMLDLPDLQNFIENGVAQPLTH